MQPDNFSSSCLLQQRAFTWEIGGGGEGTMAHFIPETGKENEACLLQAVYISRENQAEQVFL